MLTTAGGVALSLIRFCIAISPPNVVVVSEQDASSMAALGAAALAYSASKIASASIGFVGVPTTPGSLQLLGPLNGAGWTCVNEPELYCDRAKVERNVFQSFVL